MREATAGCGGVLPNWVSRLLSEQKVDEKEEERIQSKCFLSWRRIKTTGLFILSSRPARLVIFCAARLGKAAKIEPRSQSRLPGSQLRLEAICKA